MNGNDGMICIVGYHRLVDNMDETSFLQEELSCMEMENQRIRDFYHASLSEAFAYAELDLEKGQLRQQVVSGQSAHQGLKGRRERSYSIW